MPFKLSDLPETFKSQVNFIVPGTKVKKRIKAEFLLQTREQQKDWLDMEGEESDQYFEDTILVGLHEVTDEDNQAVDPSDAKALMQHHFIRLAVIDNYWKTVRRDKPQRGN